MDLSGINNLVDMFGKQSKEVMKSFNGMDKILSNLKSQIPDEKLEDFKEVFELNNKLKRGFENEVNPHDITNEILKAQDRLKRKYEDNAS